MKNKGCFLAFFCLAFLFMAPKSVKASVYLSATYFPDPVFRATLAPYDLNGNGFLDDYEIYQIKKVDCREKGVTSLEGVAYLGSLEYLDCSWNSITSLDLDGCHSLTSLYCQNNSLSSLTLGNCSGLQYCYCGNNELTGFMDLSDYTSLRHVDCANNQLSRLDLHGLSDLVYAAYDNNPLEFLDLSDTNEVELKFTGTTLHYLHLNNTELTSLTYDGHELQFLDVRGCKKLQEINCPNNYLKGLFLDGCNALKRLNCEDNDLSELDLAGLVSLKEVWCGQNRLTKLELPGVSGMLTLDCSGNLLQDLSVKNVSSLLRLDCSYNDLFSLDLTGCSSLSSLLCNDNSFWILDVTPCKTLINLVKTRPRVSSMSSVDTFQDGPDVFLAVGKGIQVVTGSTVLSASSAGLELDEVTLKYGVYRLNEEKKTAAFLRPTSTGRTLVSVSSSLKVGDKTYKVTQIAKNACRNMTGLRKVTIGKYVTTISANAFMGCSSLKTLTGGQSLISIKTNAFRGCKALPEVILYSKVKNIGVRAFYGCSRLKTITVLGKRLAPATVGSYAFKGIYSKVRVYCPSGMVSSYRTLLRGRGMSSSSRFSQI